jgi:glucose-1-phosphate cytidylyltransferase
MKAVILAGGLGTRLSEETHLKPKPMVEIGGMPILWHIMKIYSAYGIHQFIICLGYKGYVIKEFFNHYFLHRCDVTINLSENHVEIHQNKAEPWIITLVDTGENTMTGGRLKRIAPYLDDGEDFCFTYGDGLADVNIEKLIAFHRKQGTLATVTSVRPPARFGALHIVDNKVSRFEEKPVGEGGWINGGYFVLSPRVLDLIEGDQCVWEHGPMESLAAMGELSAFCHEGFWRPLDTLRDKVYLEELWASGKTAWAVWEKPETLLGSVR